MKKVTLWVTIALMMGFGLTACNSDSDEPTPATEVPTDDDDTATTDDDGDDNFVYDLDYISLTRGERQLVNSGNEFAFNLFRQARTENANMVLSPISITYALGMLNNGAAGETQQQINQVLGFADTGADGVNAFCRKMLSDAPRLDSLTKVRIANTIYVNSGYQLVPSFLECARSYYDAEPESRDFADGKTMDVINQWASNHTKGMIKKVLDESTFNPDAVSYLLNAIYFKGSWTQPFDKSDTREEEFEGVNMSKQPIMHMNDTLSYTEDDFCQALTLPYGKGLYSMTVLLPKEGKRIGDVLQQLNADNWRHYVGGGDAIVDVKLPRFESNTDVGLNDVMAQLGMPRAFTSFAEFPNFCDTPTYIDMMKQVARIKVNEEGSEAAAVTVIGMYTAYSGGELPALPHVTFHATRPFLYIISEQSSGAIFFIGQYVE